MGARYADTALVSFEFLSGLRDLSALSMAASPSNSTTIARRVKERRATILCLRSVDEGVISLRAPWQNSHSHERLENDDLEEVADSRGPAQTVRRHRAGMMV